MNIFSKSFGYILGSKRRKIRDIESSMKHNYNKEKVAKDLARLKKGLNKVAQDVYVANKKERIKHQEFANRPTNTPKREQKEQLNKAKGYVEGWTKLRKDALCDMREKKRRDMEILKMYNPEKYQTKKKFNKLLREIRNDKKWKP